MAEDKFMALVTGFILFSLFGFLLITAINNSADEYDKDTTTITGGVSVLGNSSFYENASSISTTSQSLYTRYTEQGIFETAGDVMLGGLFNMLNDMFGMAMTGFTLLGRVLSHALPVAIPQIVINVLLGIITLVVIFAIWRVIKVGD